MKTFNLPDLGEGLPDAEIVEWLVNEGEDVTLDQPLVSMETAKAVVEVPSPFTGKLTKQYGQAGDVIDTGAPLADFEVADQAATESKQETTTETAPEEPQADAGTVVGKMESSNQVVTEQASSVQGVKILPAARAIAKKMKIDISQVKPTGPNNTITPKDVKAFVQNATTATANVTSTSGVKAGYEPIRGTRRTMIRSMSESHAEIVPTTLVDDADITHWEGKQDITIRLIKALVTACKAEPSLNAWFDQSSSARKLHSDVNIGIAVDTADGLFVPTLHQTQTKTDDQLRTELNDIKSKVTDRSLTPEQLSGFTIMLSNFGKFAGRYATPIIAKPCVAILAAGKLYEQPQVKQDDNNNISVVTHRYMPLSLTFDHRAATGGEAARFLAVLLDELTKAN